MTEVTRILAAIDGGDEHATTKLFPIVYDELRRLAAAKLSRETPGQTLQATALVNEVFLRLVGAGAAPLNAPTASREKSPARSSTWQSRGHFFAAAAEAMRQILVEQARRKHRIKRGGDRIRVELSLDELTVEPPAEDILALDEALAKLESLDKSKAQVVKLRYFSGLNVEDTATAMGISTPTVKRYWAFARAWLLREISKGDELPS